MRGDWEVVRTVDIRLVCAVLACAAVFVAGGTTVDVHADATNAVVRCDYSDSLRALPQLRGVMSPVRDMTEDDFATLREWGVKLLRYQMVRGWGVKNADRDLDDYDKWLGGKLDHLEFFVLPTAVRYGMKVVIDLHVPPGGKGEGDEMNMFYEPEYAKHFVRCWMRIAKRFRGNAAVYGYDLINEPKQTRPPAKGMDCWTLQRKTAERIRTIDPDTPIIVETNLAASPYAMPSKPFDLKDIIYQVHVYIPVEYTHQRVFANQHNMPMKWPDPSRGWERDFCIRERILKPVRDFQLKYGARIYVGEFSAICWAEGADRYLSDCIDLFEEFGWDWTYHAFREWEGWSVEHEGPDAGHIVRSADNPRKRVLLKAFSKGGGSVVADEYPARFVNPFIGTAGTGHTFPGACVPFGMVQASPDCGTESWNYCSGYRYEDDSIFGFSQTHLNGTGGEDLGDVLLLPFCGNAEARGWKERIDKKTETASPGYYAVTLADSGIRVEVTATEHAALYRFRYDGEGPARLLYDGQWGIVHEGWMADYMKSFSFGQDGDRGFSGQRQTKSWNLREIGFNVVFDRPCTSCTKLPRMKSGEKGGRYVFEFDLKPGETLLVKVGLAAGGAQERGALPERAKANLNAEIPGWDFDGVRDAARQKWNEVLGRAVVEGTDDQKTNWYTSLYRLCIQPNNMADVGDRPFYSTFSCWDTFRAAGPLYTILCPEKASAFVDSMLEQGRRTGYLPIWTLWGTDNQCMIGTHSVPMIVDWFLKERMREEVARRKYWEDAYNQIKETLTKSHEGRHKENWDLYDQYGYYPFDKIRGESVSRTMECAYDDWCAAVMAEKLGHADDAAFFFKRSANWKNVFDPSIGLVRGRDTAGRWREPFDPYALGHGADMDNDFTEGNAFQYSWHVMQDVKGLVDMMGGRKSFAEKLDALFEAQPKTEGKGCVVDITGLIGQYVHGNEPSHHVIYFYPQIGHPEKAAERIREVFDKFYLPKPDGLCGNDDCGQMSAWYLFSAMGFYPFNPCGGEYIIGAPQVACAKLRVGSGEFRVVARNLSKENKYVKSVTLNGKPITDWKIRHADIVKGGELVFEMEGAK